jgi:anhydro-N-acetylmuramic acid kinase
MKWFEDFRQKSCYHAIGLMSGTSADGLDIAHIRLEKRPNKPHLELLSFHSQPFSDTTREFILATAAPDGGNVEEVCSLNFFLGHLFSNYLMEFLEREKISKGKIDFIGSHGQTICHLPKKTEREGVKFSSTLQITDPSIIANQTKILTVGDFRVADMALGGEGAPLVPFFDALYFGHPQKNRILLNIGGIANLTALPAAAIPKKVIAFDTGPGNVLIDMLARRFFEKPFDENGLIARQGKVHPGLLELLLAERYFYVSPPKSTGRELFAGPVLEKILTEIKNKKIAPQDTLATVTELTARTIFEATQKFLDGSSTWDELIISGGGADNRFLVERLRDYFSFTRVIKSDEVGILGEAKEAVCFAVLAYHTLQGLPGNLPSVTGASQKTVLGKICVPYL